MLDKGQIKDWEGEPESAERKKQASNLPPESTPIGQYVVTGESVTLTPAQEKARKRRGHWIAIGLFAFVIVIFMLTMTKMGANILVRDL